MWSIYRISADDGVAWLPVAYAYAENERDALRFYRNEQALHPALYPPAPVRAEALPTAYRKDAAPDSVFAVAVGASGDDRYVEVEITINIVERRIGGLLGGPRLVHRGYLQDKPDDLLLAYVQRQRQNADELSRQMWAALGKGDDAARLLVRVTDPDSRNDNDEKLLRKFKATYGGRNNG